MSEPGGRLFRPAFWFSLLTATNGRAIAGRSRGSFAAGRCAARVCTRRGRFPSNMEAMWGTAAPPAKSRDAFSQDAT